MPWRASADGQRDGLASDTDKAVYGVQANADREQGLRFVVNDLKWNVHVGLEDAPGARVFSSLDRVFELNGPQVSSGVFCHVIKWCVAGRKYYVKRYRPQGKHFRKAFSRDRSDIECRNLTYFAQMGIPVPKVVAEGSQRSLGLLRRGAIVTEEVPRSVDLQTLIRTRPDLFRDPEWRSRVMGSLAVHVRRLHEDGFTHRDLKWRNILVTAEEPPRVFLLDCPSGRHTSRLWRKHFIVKDLALLDRSARECLSRTTRLRFYLRYRCQTRLRREDRQLVARIMGFQFRHRGAFSHHPPTL